METQANIEKYVKGLKDNPPDVPGLQQMSKTLRSHPIFSHLLVSAILDLDDPFDVKNPSYYHCKLLQQVAACFTALASETPGGYLTDCIPTGFHSLNPILAGGIPRGQLFAFGSPRSEAYILSEREKRLFALMTVTAKSGKLLHVSLESQPPQASSKSKPAFCPHCPRTSEEGLCGDCELTLWLPLEKNND